MDRKDRLCLEKIINEINTLELLLRDYTSEKFLEDEMAKRAVSMTLLNIGEISTLLSKEFISSTSNIPWPLIRGLRNRAAHGYHSLRMKDIWTTIQRDIPKLKQQLKELL